MQFVLHASLHELLVGMKEGVFTLCKYPPHALATALCLRLPEVGTLSFAAATRSNSALSPLVWGARLNEVFGAVVVWRCLCLGSASKEGA